MPLDLYVAYVTACVVIAIVPGPVVTLVVGNSVSHGARAGLVNVIGTQAGLALMLGLLLGGLASAVEHLGWWFDWLRLAGAAYLVWLGLKLWRAGSAAVAGQPVRTAKPRGGFLLQGFLVTVSNPKMLLFFGAFIPQFIDAGRPAGPQVLLLGLTAMGVALLSDGAYALLAGRAATVMSARRQRLAARASGLMLMGGGVWLAFSRSR